MDLKRTWALLSVAGVMLAGCGDYFIGHVEEGDLFTQVGGHVVVDMLWVVDNSGTMSEEQAALETAAVTFLDALLSEDIDFHLAVTTTDTSDPESTGLLMGSPAVLTRETPDLYDAFLERALVGYDGGRSEQGLQAVHAALSEPLRSGKNAGFLRADAELAILVISDEDDQSSLSVAEFEAFLATLKPSGAVTFSALVGDVPFGCASSTGAADPGAKYIEVARDLGGIVQSICADGYGAAMSRLAHLLGHIEDTFVLSQIPDPDTLRVEVDGVTIRNRDVDGWVYLPDLNAVRISGTPLPVPGQEVRVTYDPFTL